jgi:hypothetical protein
VIQPLGSRVLMRRQTPTPRLDDSESIPRLGEIVITLACKSLAARANIVRRDIRHLPLIRAKLWRVSRARAEALAGFVLIPLWRLRVALKRIRK